MIAMILFGTGNQLLTNVYDLQENENIANLENFPFTETEGLKV